jgi:hypothetical protein
MLGTSPSFFRENDSHRMGNDGVQAHGSSFAAVRMLMPQKPA